MREHSGIGKKSTLNNENNKIIQRISSKLTTTTTTTTTEEKPTYTFKARAVDESILYGPVSQWNFQEFSKIQFFVVYFLF